MILLRQAFLSTCHNLPKFPGNPFIQPFNSILTRANNACRLPQYLPTYVHFTTASLVHPCRHKPTAGYGSYSHPVLNNLPTLVFRDLVLRRRTRQCYHEGPQLQPQLHVSLGGNSETNSSPTIKIRIVIFTLLRLDLA